MVDMYTTIASFSKIKERCFFCGGLLRCRLSNFIIMDGEVPIINAALSNDKFTFRLSRTTASYTVEASAIIYALSNQLKFKLEHLTAPSRNLYDTSTSSVDTMIAKETFLDFRPHIQLYCPRLKNCPFLYTISSDIFKLSPALTSENPSLNRDWIILPFQMYSESFISGHLWVQNDYLRNQTYIYARNKTDADPLITPMINFESMGPEKLLNRIKTIVVFS